MRHTRIIVTHYGGPDALQVVEEECPEPKDGEVGVRVLAAGVSLPDVMAREGVHPETPPDGPEGTQFLNELVSSPRMCPKARGRIEKSVDKGHSQE